MKKAKTYIVVIPVKLIECMGVPNLSEQRATARRKQSGLTKPPLGSLESHLDLTIGAYGELAKNVAYVGAGTIPGAIIGAGTYLVALDPLWREHGAPWVDKAAELARDLDELGIALKDSKELEEVRISEFLTEYYAGVEPINAQEAELLSEFLDTIAKYQTTEWQLNVLLNEAGYITFTGADLFADFLDESGMWKTEDLEKACNYSAGSFLENSLADFDIFVNICDEDDDGFLCYSFSDLSKDTIGFDVCDDVDRELAITYYGTLHQLHDNIEEAMVARKDLTLAIEVYQQANELTGNDLGVYALDVNEINGMGGLDIVLESGNSQLAEMKHSLLAIDRIIINSTEEYEAVQETYGEVIKSSREDLEDLEKLTGRDYSAELEQLHKETMETTEALQRFADERVTIYTNIEYKFKQESLMGQYEEVFGESIQEEGTALFAGGSALMGLTAGLFVASSLRSTVRRKHGCGLLKFIFYEGPKNTLKFPLIDGPVSTINAIGETIGTLANGAYILGKEIYDKHITPNQPK